MDFIPAVGEADELMKFDRLDFTEHAQDLAQHMSRVGEAICARKANVREGKAFIKRKEAQMKLEFELFNLRGEEDAQGFTKYSVAGQDARIALDPEIVACERALAKLEGEIEKLQWVLYKPLETKKEMLTIFSGQMRTEKETYNQTRGRNA
jgi:hypothetical protein